MEGPHCTTYNPKLNEIIPKVYYMKRFIFIKFMYTIKYVLYQNTTEIDNLSVVI